MASVFDYPAVLQNQDEVRASHGVEVVGNDQARLPGHEAIQGFLDLRLALDVETRHRLVQDHDGNVPDDGPGDGYPLALPSGEGVAPLADDGLVPILEVHDEVVGVGCFGGLDNLLRGGVQLPVGDVLLDGGAEDDRVLEDGRPWPRPPRPSRSSIPCPRGTPRPSREDPKIATLASAWIPRPSAAP